jgi:hypothetical protein
MQGTSLGEASLPPCLSEILLLNWVGATLRDHHPRSMHLTRAVCMHPSNFGKFEIWNYHAEVLNSKLGFCGTKKFCVL